MFASRSLFPRSMVANERESDRLTFVFFFSVEFHLSLRKRIIILTQ